jgi:hypothetical protein
MAAPLTFKPRQDLVTRRQGDVGLFDVSCPGDHRSLPKARSNPVDFVTGKPAASDDKDVLEHYHSTHNRIMAT